MDPFEGQSIRELQVPLFHGFRTILSQVMRQSRRDIMFVDFGDCHKVSTDVQVPT